MNTPSHLIMTAALRKVLRDRLPAPLSAVLLGAVAPDLPLYLMSIGGLFYYRCVLGWESRPTFEHLFDELYFHDPLWIAAHNTLHSPTLLLLSLAGMWVATNLQRTIPSWIFWFLMACLFHSIVDVFTHNGDGPLLFFPFEWNTRFDSPISYWDRNHYGRYFARFEIGLDVVLLIYLFARPSVSWWRNKRGEMRDQTDLSSHIAAE